MYSILHIIPSSVFANQWHGAYKDVVSRINFLQRDCPKYKYISVCSDSVQTEWLKTCDEKTRFLFEYSTLPKTVASVRAAFPSARICVRSHNVEPFQHLDNHGLWPSGKGPLWTARGMFRLLRGDCSVKQNATTIWAINEREAGSYWSMIPGNAEVQWAPYHCPDFLLPTSPRDADGRVVIACMPTSQMNRKSIDLVQRFVRFAERMKACGLSRYRFVITGDLSGWCLPTSDVVECTGMVSDLRFFLPSVAAVAMLSPLGRGFKTTIGDAIANGARVLAHPTQRDRCPTVYHPAIMCIPDGFSDASRLEEFLLRAVDTTSIDIECRARQEQMLSSLLMN